MTDEQAPDAARGLPRTWHPFRSHNGDDVVMQELVRAIKAVGRRGATPTTSEIQVRLGELKSLINAAERGELSDQDWRPVSRDPALWELRWQWWAEHLLVRGYFHEPATPSHQTVVAKVHVKEVIRGDENATRRLQNRQIDEAGGRISFGRPDRWGLDTTDPIFPRASS